MAVTVFLTLSAVGLWLAIVQALLLCASELSVHEQLRLRLPWHVEHLVPLSRWMSLYWWAVVLAAGTLTPVVGLVTYWIRHRLRCALWKWLWGVLLIAVPGVVLAVVLQSSLTLSQSAARQLREQRERLVEYLSADGQQLRWPLKIREIRHGTLGPVGEVLIIDSGGDWRITPVGTDDKQPPLRRGKLRQSRLRSLAYDLAAQQLLDFSVPDVGPPPVMNGDSLCIEFGPHVAELPGVRRRTWWQEFPEEAWQDELRSRLRAVVLAVDDLVNARAAP